MTRAYELASRGWQDSVDTQARDSATINSWNIEVLRGTTGPQAMINTIVDTLADETGIDTSASTGEIYDADADYYTNATEFKTARFASNAIHSTTVGTYGDGKQATIEAFFRLNGSDSTALSIVSNADSGGFVRLERHSDNKIRLRGWDLSSNEDMKLYSSSEWTQSDGWIHVVASFDTAAGVGKLYINGADDTGTASFVNDNINLQYGYWTIGQAGANPADMDIHRLWFDKTYIDLTNASNLAKFYSSGAPVDLGADGTVPTGTCQVFYKGDMGTLRTDISAGGTVGDLSQTDGTTPINGATFTSTIGAMSLETTSYTADAAPDEVRILAELEGVAEGENLIIRSEELETSWTASNLSVTTDVTTDPIGGSTADKIVENTTNQAHELYQNATIVSGQVYTFSCHAKADSRSLVKVSFRGNVQSHGVEAVFDLSSGTYVETSYGTPTNKAFSITSLGAGWYRCSVAGVIPSETNARALIRLIETGTTEVYTGDGSSGLFVWGAQLDQGSTASTYVKTEASGTGAVAVIGRDIEMMVSRDGGTTFVGVTEEQVATLGGGEFLVAGTGDVSDNAPDTACRAKITTVAGKLVRVNKISLQADKGLAV